MLDFVVGAAHVPTLLDHLTEGALVITPGDRADLLVAASAAHVAGQVSVAGLVLTLGEQPDPRAMRLVEGLNTGLAVLSVRQRQLRHGGRVQPDRGPAQRDQPAQGGGRARRVRGAAWTPTTWPAGCGSAARRGSPR